MSVSDITQLSPISSEPEFDGDWLVQKPHVRAAVYRGTDFREIALSNGLLRRRFRLTPNAATVALDNLTTGASLLRAVGPEARIEVDGHPISVGGLIGQPERAYLAPEWIDSMRADPASLAFRSFKVGPTEERFAWMRSRRSEGRPWPPHGARLSLLFEGAAPALAVEVHYELYDGLPVLAKWLTIHNRGANPVTVTGLCVETLALVEGESAVGKRECWRLPDLHIASDYAFGGDTPENADKVAHWILDPEYTSQVNYERQTPALLECRLPLGPAAEIPPGRSLDSFRVFELALDSSERERRGLAIRRMYRTLAPWCTENPIMMHLTTVDEGQARAAMDQCAEVGFEMVIFSFGSGLNMEDASAANIAKFRALADYAHRRGLQVGGYSLLASRRISDEEDVVNPTTGKPDDGAIFGASPCLGSAWAGRYFDNLRAFLNGTGFDLLEHDGSYPGDVCASTRHPGHTGLADSQWTQFQTISAFYRWCRRQGIYLNVPDWYFLAGSNKSGMGYREDNWSLPRERQLILARQNMYDGTWDKAPSMGWMFVPLVEYHGGGEAATIEPLDAHRDTYGAHMANDFGYGVQACYRGMRLYDTPATREVVEHWVAWFKQHRAILESDVIHIRRADGREPDAILHVNPELRERAMLVAYNPSTVETIARLRVPLYYAGLAGRQRVEHADGRSEEVDLDSAHCCSVRIKLPARTAGWAIFKKD